MSDSGPGRREVAYRLFAAEFDDAEFSYSESDEERAPNYVVTPTGARVNRLFAVGVLTEVEDVNPEMVRGRLVDPTGAFVTYAGQYQPDELAFLERADPPTFLALSGKARTFEPDDGDRVYTSVRPESVSEVDAETRDRWVVTAAERTLERIGIVASAIDSELSGDRLRTALEEAGVDDRLADGVALALEYYDTTPAYLDALRETALGALEVVAGERDEVDRLDVDPDEGRGGPDGQRGDAAALATLELSAPEMPETSVSSDSADEAAATGDASGDDEPDDDAAEPEPDGEPAGATTGSPTTADPDVETAADQETGTTAASGVEPDASTATDGDPETGAVSGTAPEPEPDVDADAAGEGSVEAGSGDGTSEGSVDLEPEDATEAAAEPEPSAEVTPEANESETTAESVEAAGQEPEPADVEVDDDFDPGEFELDEEERREVEEEYGTEFSTAGEMDEPDETDDRDDDTAAAEEAPESAPADEPDEEGAAEPETEAESEAEPQTEPEPEPKSEPEPETEAGSEPEADADAEAGSEPADDVDVEDAVVETMEALDDGDGADREELVATVVDEYGADPEAVEAAIQDALMSGRCYEPSDGALKSI